MSRLPRHGTSLLLACTLLSAGAYAREFDPRSLSVTGPDGKSVRAASDGDVATAWTSENGQHPGMALTIDFGRTCAVHRVYLSPGSFSSHYPRGLRLSVGNTPDDLDPFLVRELPREVETNLRFNPVVGRVLRIEIAGEGAGYPWSVAEMLIFGSGSSDGLQPRDCVVVPADAPPLLRLSAEELRYYVGELTGRPLPITEPGREGGFPGIAYVVSEPPRLAGYEELMRAGVRERLETGRVHAEGKRVLFTGRSQLGVLNSVYEFLGRQGVRWLFPDPLGDHIPAGGVDLAVLPLECVPAFHHRYANWNTERHRGIGDEYLRNDAYLWYYRNRWNSTWSGPLGERPDVPEPGSRPWFGYTHTFAAFVPGSLYEDHPRWFPILRRPKWIKYVGVQGLGRRLPYSATWGLNFCTSNPEVVDHVAETIAAACDPPTVRETAWVTPMDAGKFCDCRSCRDLDRPEQPGSPYMPHRESLSNRYFTFIDQLAGRLRRTKPNVSVGAFAYEVYLQPPVKFPRLPDNVLVDVVQYGSYNLPLGSEQNRDMRKMMEGWATRWPEPGNLGIYDWALLLGKADRMPVPLVTALGERLAAFHRMGARRIGTQADATEDVWRSNPWNFYAYSRLIWDPQESVEAILSEFFGGYYRESAAPMRKYYRTLEKYLLDGDIPLGRDYNYRPPAGGLPASVFDAMHGHLKDAVARARHWVVRQRVAEAVEGFSRFEEPPR